MDAIIFLRNLRMQIPSDRELGPEVDRVMYEMILEDYIFDFETTKKEDEIGDPIINLIKLRKDCSWLVGLVQFRKEIFEKNTLLSFGLFSENDLVLDTSSGEIKVVDLYDPNRVIYYCARNSNVFLDLMLLYAKYNAYSSLLGMLSLEEKQNYLEKAYAIVEEDKYMRFVKIIFEIDYIIEG